MKHSLQLKLSQHLTLTPQLQQSIRLLQLSTLELNQELEVFISKNPLLERSEPELDDGGGGGMDGAGVIPGSFQESASTTSTSPQESEQPSSAPEGEEYENHSWDNVSNYGSRDDGEESDYPQLAAESETLRAHLLWQLNPMQLSDRDKVIVSLLIDALNDDGYLTMDLEELAAILPPELQIEVIELHTALKHLQNMDPAGVGARDLSECLCLQLQVLPADTPYRTQAMTTAKQYLDVLAAHDYNKLKKLLQLDDAGLREVKNLIVRLNPRPGADYASVDTRYIVHDVVVRKVKGQWVATLNQDAVPKLRINRMYADILSRNRDSSYQQLTSQLQEAKWLIKNVQQRFDTILRVSQAIVDRQKHFFEHGEVAMRPLVLREIAEAVGLHESTVSRVTTQKYMFTPRGIFELKYFFGSHVATETGGACSATAIRALIKQLVSVEDTRKPLSDSQITEILASQGIVVARRTIAKYRESLQIPAVNLRKSI